MIVLLKAHLHAIYNQMDRMKLFQKTPVFVALFGNTSRISTELSNKWNIVVVHFPV